MIKIYLGYEFNQAPEDFKDKIYKLKDVLSGEYEVLGFDDLNNLNSNEIYKKHIKSILTSDIFLVVCDHPSIELGYEMSVALEKYSKPVLAVTHKDIEVNNFIKNISHPAYTFGIYENIEDIYKLIKEKELKHFKTSAEAEMCESDICAI